MKFISAQAMRLVLAGAMLLGAHAAGARGYGYCTDNINRNNIFRSGTSETQGLAICLGPGKLAALKGCTISGVSAAFGSSRTTAGTVELFVATAPDAEPLASQTASIPGAVKWIDFAFDQPYTITGDEGALYVGYRAEINPKSSMLLADASADAPGLAAVYTDGVWTDLCGQGFGMPSIRAIIDDAPPFTDLMIKPVAVEGYFKAGVDYATSAQIFNFGNTEVGGLQLSVATGSGLPATLAVDGVLLPGQTMDVALPAISSEAEGMLPVLAAVSAEEDADPTDNTCSAQAFFYPSAMERSVLLEGFTGQACSNCPAAHTLISEFLATATEVPVVEVMHHSGYQPDLYTMDADMDYTYFYGSPSTFAPAMMVDRAVVPSIAAVPVMNTSAANLRTAYTAALQRQPYVSLALQSSFDPASRTLSVELSTLAHNTLPSELNVLNVMLVQNALTGNQTPYGDGYVHNAVHRGVLTGNSWGVALPADACATGGTARWSATVTLPEYIFSDYWADAGLTDEQKQVFSTPLVPEHMYLVAYVGSCDTGSLAGHTVYNTVEAPLGGSRVQGGFSGITDAVAPAATDIRVVGRRILGAPGMRVYTPDGRLADASSDLSPGIYIVRAGAASRKVVVR